MTTVLLHGFWGQPADWTDVIQRLPLGENVWAPDLYEPGPLAPHHDIQGWCAHFFEELEERVGSKPVQAVGYSMGGRLLANLLTLKPEKFSRALVLSANPLPHDRSHFEAEWRKKFLDQPWEILEKEWAELGVFTGSDNRPRRKNSVMREMLGQTLINWSPAKNIYAVDQLKSLETTVEWAFGALDQKYVGIAKDLATLPVRGQISVLENAGHRLLLDAAPWVGSWICKNS